VQVAGIDSLLTSWKLSTEIPSYLACVAVADYTHVDANYFSVSQGINIPVMLTSKASDTTNFKNSFLNLNNAMAAYESLYGPYVWEKIGYSLVPFNGGAMEHATNIAYPLIVINGTLVYETLMAHELSHHWWGNWVTCSTAEEMWINEGIASYSEALFLEAVYGQDAYMSHVRDNHYDVVHKAHINDEGFYALNAVPIEFTYGNTSYNKGADVMHSLRGYMGDTKFFEALQNVQDNYGGKDISSEEFRDQMNTVAGVDVTDFFNDWILSPGFSHFATTNVTATQNGANYDVSVTVVQRLKGASNYHTNVPLQLTFMDDNWTSHTEEIIMSGNVQVFNFSLPFAPKMTAVNMNERISDAITAENLHVTNTITYTSNYSNCRLIVQNLQDSALVRIEHNWVAPYYVGAPANVAVSPDRYWTVKGVDLANISGAKLRFEFDAQQTSVGDLDNGLLVTLGGQAFREDSIVLLYRPNDNEPWVIHSDYTLNKAGSGTDKKGSCTANIFMEGQYTFGYRAYSVGIQEHPESSLTYSIYPNPADDSVTIDLSEWKKAKYAVEIYAINGQLMEKHNLYGGEHNQLELNLDAGAYLFIICDDMNSRLGSKRVIVK
jgi:aminopeptidase N